MIEAAAEGIPLLLFTADRPEELHGTGANQTIDQHQIFGNYPELFLHMPTPEDATQSKNSSNPEEFLFKSLQDSFNAAASGPVHVNWMFREPFTIDHTDNPEVDTNPSASFAKVFSDQPIDDDSSTLVETSGETLIALGSCNPAEAKEALQLAEKLGCPILTDITRGLRSGSFELPTDFSLPRPDTVLHLGGRITSKSWHQWTNQLRDSGTQFIHLTPTGRVVNPNRLSQQMHRTSLENLTEKVSGQPASDSFRRAWQQAARTRSQAVNRMLSGSDQLSEPAIANFLCQNCPESGPLFVGNSMAIRDMDWYGTRDSDQPRPTFANRGASGIDGLIATATGVAIGTGQPATIVLGDLSALHDLNSLALVAGSPVPLIVVVINNQSGHIFDHLPVRKSEHFEQYFATPHSFQFEHAAKMFGLPYRRTTTMLDLREAYLAATAGHQSIVLEVPTDRKVNTEIRQLVREEIQQCSNQH